MSKKKHKAKLHIPVEEYGFIEIEVEETHDNISEIYFDQKESFDTEKSNRKPF